MLRCPNIAHNAHLYHAEDVANFVYLVAVVKQLRQDSTISVNMAILLTHVLIEEIVTNRRVHSVRFLFSPELFNDGASEYGFPRARLSFEIISLALEGCIVQCDYYH